MTSMASHLYTPEDMVANITATLFYYFLVSDVQCKNRFAHHTSVDYQDFEDFSQQLPRMAYN